MDFEFTEELKQLQSLAKQFVQKELLPLEKMVEEKGEFPEPIRVELKNKALKLGLWNYAVPEKLGGGGFSALGIALVHEEVGKVSAAVGMLGGIGGSVVTVAGEQFDFATDEQREKYLIPVIRDGKEMFIALTEPNAGSDTAAIETRAVKQGDNYVLNGTKTFVTALNVADFMEVYAVTDWKKRGKGGISLFIVEKGFPGLSVGRHIPAMGRFGLHSYEMSFSDCLVPAKNLLWKEGDGLRIGMRSLSLVRFSLCARLIGAAQRAMDMTADYARKRITFGKPLIERQFIQGMLVDTFTDIFTARMMLYNLAWRTEQGADPRAETALLKVLCSEIAFNAIDRAMQIHGGLGYTKDLPLEMMFRDIRLYRIGDGPSEVLRWYAARELFAK